MNIIEATYNLIKFIYSLPPFSGSDITPQTRSFQLIFIEGQATVTTSISTFDFSFLQNSVNLSSLITDISEVTVTDVDSIFKKQITLSNEIRTSSPFVGLGIMSLRRIVKVNTFNVSLPAYYILLHAINNNNYILTVSV